MEKYKKIKFSREISNASVSEDPLLLADSDGTGLLATICFSLFKLSSSNSRINSLLGPTPSIADVNLSFSSSPIVIKAEPLT